MFRREGRLMEPWSSWNLNVWPESLYTCQGGQGHSRNDDGGLRCCLPTARSQRRSWRRRTCGLGLGMWLLVLTVLMRQSGTHLDENGDDAHSSDAKSTLSIWPHGWRPCGWFEGMTMRVTEIENMTMREHEVESFSRRNDDEGCCSRERVWLLGSDDEGWRSCWSLHVISSRMALWAISGGACQSTFGTSSLVFWNPSCTLSSGEARLKIWENHGGIALMRPREAQASPAWFAKPGGRLGNQCG